MRSILPIFAILVLLLGAAFAMSVSIVLLSSGSCSSAVAPVGTVMVYEVDPQWRETSGGVDAERMVAAIDHRINTGWTSIARIDSRNDGRIEIGVYGKDPAQVQNIERLLAYAGTLEFRVLANKHDHQELIEKGARRPDRVVFNDAGELAAFWVAVRQGRESEFENYPEIATRTTRAAGQEVLEVLVVTDSFDVSEAHLQRASLGVDSGGLPCVDLALDSTGGELLNGLTMDNLSDQSLDENRRLGIILDGRLHSAPLILTPIWGRAQIAGGFSEQEVDDLVSVLNAGALPAAVRQVEKNNVEHPQGPSERP